MDTSTVWESILAKAPDLLKAALADLREPFADATAEGFGESGDKGPKISVPLKLVVDFSKSPPEMHATGKVSVIYGSETESVSLDDGSQPNLPGIE